MIITTQKLPEGWFRSVVTTEHTFVCAIKDHHITDEEALRRLDQWQVELLEKETPADRSAGADSEG